MKKTLIICYIVIIILLSPLTISQIPTDYDNNQETYSLVRIPINNLQDKIFEHGEIVGGLPGEYIDAVIPSQILTTDYFNIYNITIIEPDLYAPLSSFAKEYQTLSEMEQNLYNIAQEHENITKLYSIGKSIENRDIWCLEINTNPELNEEKPGVLFMGLHHAREWPTLEICMYIAEQLTTNYKIDPGITSAVDNNQIFIVPCLNPDGYYYDHDETGGNTFWRKNRRFFPDFNEYGTDLNRNYPGSNNGDISGMWGSIKSISHHPESELHCGSSPLSEPETQSIKNLYLNNENICTSISWHTYSELVLWPWSYTKDKVTPDNEYMAQIGEEIASKITKQNGKGTYTSSQTSELYPTTGDLTDWLYGYSHYILGKTHFPYTIEACDNYHPSSSVLNQVCQENFDGALYLLQQAEYIYNEPKRVLPPIITEISYENNSEYQISWIQNPMGATPEYYQIDELSNLDLQIDDATLPDNWIFESFSITDIRSHSDDKSYKSNKMVNNISAMTTKYPIPIEKNMNLSFWCWYDITYPYHQATVEISQDGRQYKILDVFSDNSDEWEYHEYNLSEYYGESIFIRFRYVTDINNPSDGFFVDDIYPISKFYNIKTITESITESSIKITLENDGKYYYQIKGYQSDHGWGDYNTLKSITVNLNDNHPPTAPEINGPTKGKIGKNYNYTIKSIDPDGDQVSYLIIWDDETTTDWIGPFPSGQTIEITHNWSFRDNYIVKARAKDIYDQMGNWTDIRVQIPYQQFLYFLPPIFTKLINHFLTFYKIHTENN